MPRIADAVLRLQARSGVWGEADRSRCLAPDLAQADVAPYVASY
jgi:hypothetical protein